MQELGFSEVRHFTTQGERRAADAKALAFLLERHSGFCGQLRRRVPGCLQAERQRHGETSGMRGSDEFFRVGAVLVLEARTEGIRSFGEHAGIGGEIALSIAACAAPNGFCFADHDLLPWNPEAMAELN